MSLCEIARIAGRIITHLGAGHLTCELYVDKKWGYFDPRTGIFFLKPDGKVASVAELLDDPSIMEDQPKWVKCETSERWGWEVRRNKCKKHFFSRKRSTA